MRYLAVLLLLCSACTSPARQSDVPEHWIAVNLEVRVPDDSTRLQWSPKGEKLSLRTVEGGLQTELRLGSPAMPPFPIRLSKSAGANYFDELYIDQNRNDKFELHELLKTEPNEIRKTFWSSFDAELDLPITDPWTGLQSSDRYALAFWYVEDPAEDDPEQVLRFSRRGWMLGTVALDDVRAHMLVADDSMDGIFTRADSWKLVTDDSLETLRSYNDVRPLERHAWVADQAYRVEQIDPSGRQAYLAPFDPGVSRAEELVNDDKLRFDRQAPRSGRIVTFRTDFAAAEDEAQRAHKPLLIDFETEWCGPCKTMMKWVYTADAVVDAAADMVSVKVDGDEQRDIVKRFGVTGYPTTVLMQPDGDVLRNVVGYQSVAEMTAFLTMD